MSSRASTALLSFRSRQLVRTSHRRSSNPTGRTTNGRTTCWSATASLLAHFVAESPKTSSRATIFMRNLLKRHHEQPFLFCHHERSVVIPASLSCRAKSRHLSNRFLHALFLGIQFCCGCGYSLAQQDVTKSLQTKTTVTSVVFAQRLVEMTTNKAETATAQQPRYDKERVNVILGESRGSSKYLATLLT